MKIYSWSGISTIIAVSGVLIGLEAASLSSFLATAQFEAFFGELTAWEQGILISSNSIGGLGM